MQWFLVHHGFWYSFIIFGTDSKHLFLQVSKQAILITYKRKPRYFKISYVKINLPFFCSRQGFEVVKARMVFPVGIVKINTQKTNIILAIVEYRACL